MEPGIKSVTGSIKSVADKVTAKQKVISQEKDIKNAFSGKKGYFHYLINCVNREEKSKLRRFEVYNEKMDTVCYVHVMHNLTSVSATVYDSDGVKLMDTERKTIQN